MVRERGVGMRGRAARAEQLVTLIVFRRPPSLTAHRSQLKFQSLDRRKGGSPDHASAAILAEVIRSGSITGSPRLILSTFAMPSVTCPQTVYLPSRKGASAKQMKN